MNAFFYPVMNDQNMYKPERDEQQSNSINQAGDSLHIQRNLESLSQVTVFTTNGRLGIQSSRWVDVQVARYASKPLLSLDFSSKAYTGPPL